jgi:hypothetical protein
VITKQKNSTAPKLQNHALNTATTKGSSSLKQGKTEAQQQAERAAAYVSGPYSPYGSTPIHRARTGWL